MKLKPKLAADVMAVTDMSELYPGKKYLVKALKKIYPILKDKIKLPEGKLSNRNIPLLFQEIMDAINGITDDRSRFDIKLINNEYVIQKYLFHGFNENVLYSVSISFLPELRKYNEELHDLICMCLSILVDKKVPLIDPEVYDMDMELDILTDTIESEGQDNVPELVEEFKSFYKYKEEYRKLLRKPATIEMVEKQIDLLAIPKSFKQPFLNLLPHLFAVSESKFDLYKISDSAIENHSKAQERDKEDLYEDGSPVEILQMFRILWFNDEHYTNYLCEWLGDSSGNFGELLPMVCKDCNTAKEFNEIDNLYEKTYGTLCEDLAEVIDLLKNLTDDIIQYMIKCKKRKNFSSHQTYSLFTAEEVTETIT